MNHRWYVRLGSLVPFVSLVLLSIVYCNCYIYKFILTKKKYNVQTFRTFSNRIKFKSKLLGNGKLQTFFYDPRGYSQIMIHIVVKVFEFGIIACIFFLFISRRVYGAKITGKPTNLVPKLRPPVIPDSKTLFKLSFHLVM